MYCDHCVALHDLEREFQTLSDDVSKQVNCRKIEDFTSDYLKQGNVAKEMLAGIVLNMGNIIISSRDIFISSLIKYEEQQSELYNYHVQ